MTAINSYQGLLQGQRETPCKERGRLGVYAVPFGFLAKRLLQSWFLISKMGIIIVLKPHKIVGMIKWDVIWKELSVGLRM